jgi:tRNA-modifying protein YgfZ
VTDHDLRTTVGAAAVPWAVVEVQGEAAESYLQGQLSQDVAMPADETRWTFLLQPTGKVDAWLRVTRLDDDHYLLDAPFADESSIAARLDRFKLRTAVDISARGVTGWSFRGPGSVAAAAALAGDDARSLPAGWPGVEGADVLGGADLRPDPDLVVPVEVWEALRVECGVPLNGRELGPDTIPAEAGTWVIEASADFAKGCYTGQELVARIDSRGGNVPRPIRSVVVDGGSRPPARAVVVVDGKDVGTLTSVVESPAVGTIGIGPVARSVEPGTEVDLRWAGGSARGIVRVPPLR